MIINIPPPIAIAAIAIITHKTILFPLPVSVVMAGRFGSVGAIGSMGAAVSGIAGSRVSLVIRVSSAIGAVMGGSSAST